MLAHEVFLPGLLGPWPTTFRPLLKQLLEENPEVATIINKALSTKTAVAEIGNLDLELFNRLLPNTGTPPHAQIRWQVDKLKFPELTTLPAFCADPVSMQAEMHGARVHDSNILQITDSEAQQLTTDFNALFGEDGYRWVLINNRGYLFLDNQIDLQTQSLADATSSDILEWGFTGKDHSLYQKYATEWQMWLYRHPVNQARKKSGLPVVSAIWLWGEGELPQHSQANFKQIINRSCYTAPISLQGLAEHFKLPILSLDTLSDTSDKSTLIIDESLHYPAQALEPEKWFEALKIVSSNLLEPLLAEKSDFAITIPNQQRFISHKSLFNFLSRPKKRDLISASEWR